MIKVFKEMLNNKKEVNIVFYNVFLKVSLYVVFFFLNECIILYYYINDN